MHTCPRRRETGFPVQEGVDSYTPGHGLAGQAAGCSYCGSMAPDDFMTAVRGGAVIGPTDKPYKAYLHNPVTGEDRAARKAAWLADPTGVAAAVRGQAALERRDPDEAADAEWERGVGALLTGPMIGRFYYQHLTPEQCREFVELYNAGAITVGYPGHFYVWPYFMRPT